MNFLRRLLKGSGGADSARSGADSSGAGERGGNREPFDHEVRIVHLPERQPAKVWKTRSTQADDGFIYISPLPEWNGQVPTSDPVTFYIMTDARTAEFDGTLVATREGGQFAVKVARPDQMVWREKDETAVHQKRRFLRIETSLPAHLSRIVPTLAGSTLKVDEPNEARMVDLSLEGCSLISDFDPGTGRLVEVRVLGPVFPLSVQGKAVRVQIGMTQGFQYTIAIVFQNMTQVTRDMIGRYIIERQKEK